MYIVLLPYINRYRPNCNKNSQALDY